VTLNGHRTELAAGASVADAVLAAGAQGSGRGVAVAVAGEVVPRGEWEDRPLAEDDEVEVVNAVQGG